MNENHGVNIFFAKKVPSTLLRWKVPSDTWMTTIYQNIFSWQAKIKNLQGDGGDGNRMAGGVPWFVNLKWRI